MDDDGDREGKVNSATANERRACGFGDGILEFCPVWMVLEESNGFHERSALQDRRNECKCKKVEKKSEERQGKRQKHRIRVLKGDQQQQQAVVVRERRGLLEKGDRRWLGFCLEDGAERWTVVVVQLVAWCLEVGSFGSEGG
ncbi:hypothetical protein PIB30_068788 [Stylosanthes scabra]|uniref:Uncharacterized protein n=1 Tax=Stylosanthes scabra TaxID=79078 RepID=A0ABU6UMH4_9FABA|nr:hypothetical protein [Stylosanthes scabra]